MSADLKAYLEGFEPIEGNFKVGGASKKLNLWTTDAASEFYVYYCNKGNPVASKIVKALVATNFDVILGDVYNHKYEKENALKWNNTRFKGKETRLTLTDQIKNYIEMHPELGPNYGASIYCRATGLLNKTVFGKTAAELCSERGCKRNELRNKFTKEELDLVEKIESYAASLIKRGNEPYKAMEMSLEHHKILIEDYREALTTI
jgi:hypothetical protein